MLSLNHLIIAAYYFSTDMAFQSLDFTGRLQCPSAEFQNVWRGDYQLTKCFFRSFEGVRYIFNHWTVLIMERLSDLIVVVSGGYWFKVSASNLPYKNLHLNQKKFFFKLLSKTWAKYVKLWVDRRKLYRAVMVWVLNFTTYHCVKHSHWVPLCT